MNARPLILTSLLLACASLAPIGACAQDTNGEIEQLLDVLGNSHCQFYRNGTWYSGPDARAHLQKKYDYLHRKGLAETPEEFIDNGGTNSSVSGEAYEVKCGDSQPEPSAEWLREQLRLMRSSHSGEAH